MSADKVDVIAPVAAEKKVEEPVPVEDGIDGTAVVDDDAVAEVPEVKEAANPETEVKNGESDKKENGSSEEEKDKESTESTENGDSAEKVIEADACGLKRKSVTADVGEDTPPAEGATTEKKAKLADSEKNGAEVETA